MGRALQKSISKSSGIMCAGFVCVLAAGLLVVPRLVHGSYHDVAQLFNLTRYEEAGNELRVGSADPTQPAEDLLWQVRLSKDPDEVVDICTGALKLKGLPDAVRCQFSLHLATIEFGRNRFQSALFPLRAIINDHKDPLPGQIHLLAGMCYRALGQKQRSREMFASVRAQDPVFPWARYYLGQMGIETGDLALALRYFESAGNSDLAARTPILQAGVWEAMRMDNKTHEAAAISRRLFDDHPGSLATMQINEIQHRQDMENSILLAADADSVDTTEQTPDHTGRICLQLGAFRDRSLALVFIAEWEHDLPDLRIEEEFDDQGQIFYKVRTGHFVSRAQAYTEQQRLQRNHGIESIPVEGLQ